MPFRQAGTGGTGILLGPGIVQTAGEVLTEILGHAATGPRVEDRQGAEGGQRRHIGPPEGTGVTARFRDPGISRDFLGA